MDTTQLTAAMEDVRKAQRLLVAYHQRMLPIIDLMAKSLDCIWYTWSTPNCGIAGTRGNPFARNAWDFSPLNDAVFFFQSQAQSDRSPPLPEKWLLAIRLLTDSVVSDLFDEHCCDKDALAIEAEPENSQTLLRLYAYCPERLIDTNTEWWELYVNHEWPPLNGEVLALSDGGFAFGQEVNACDLTSSQVVSEKVDEFRQKLADWHCLQRQAQSQPHDAPA